MTYQMWYKKSILTLDKMNKLCYYIRVKQRNKTERGIYYDKRKHDKVRRFY